MSFHLQLFLIPSAVVFDEMNSSSNISKARCAMISHVGPNSMCLVFSIILKPKIYREIISMTKIITICGRS